MAQYNTTSAADLLKVLYPSGVETMWFPEQKFCAWLPKSAAWEGSSWQENPLFGGIHGSSGFADAMDSKTTPEHDTFNFTQVEYFVIGSIANRLLKNARTQKGRIVDVLKTHFDAAHYEWGRMMGRYIWGNGGGALGQVSSISTTTNTDDTITLSDPRDIVKFEVGMELVAAETDGTSGSLQAGSITVTKVNIDAGTLQFASDVNAAGAIPALDADDYLFRKGSFGNVLNGVEDHIPTTAPSAGESHFGVDRSQHPTRLAGVRYTADAGKAIETILFNAMAQGTVNGSRVNHCWLHPLQWGQLTNSLHGKTYYERETTKASKGDFGFTSFKLYGADGEVTISTDRDCKYSYAFLTRREAWLLASADECPHYEMQGGDKLLVEGNSDGKEFRLKGYFNLIPKRQVDNIWAQLEA